MELLLTVQGHLIKNMCVFCKQKGKNCKTTTVYLHLRKSRNQTRLEYRTWRELQRTGTIIL